MSKHQGAFYCLNCLHSFTTENQHGSHKKVCGNKDFCIVLMPSLMSLINIKNPIKHHLLFM